MRDDTAGLEQLRDIAPAVKQHAQAVEALARSIQYAPEKISAQVQAVQDRAAGWAAAVLGVGLVLGWVIGRMQGGKSS